MSIQRGDAQIHLRHSSRGHRLQDIQIAHDQRVFGDDANRLTSLPGDLQALTREAKLTLARLITIGDA